MSANKKNPYKIPEKKVVEESAYEKRMKVFEKKGYRMANR